MVRAPQNHSTSVNVELLTIKGKHLLTHVNRIKPYLVPTRSDVQFEDEKLQNKNDKKQEKFQEKVEKDKEKPVEETLIAYGFGPGFILLT